MKLFFNLGIVLVFAFLALCGYWYLNPNRAPAFLRGESPTLEWPAANNPLKNFRAPQY